MTRPFWLGPEGSRGFDHTQIPNQVIDDARLGFTDLAVYNALCRHARVSSGDTTVTQTGIAAKFAATRRPIRSALARLIRLGYIAELRSQDKVLGYRLLEPPAVSSQQMSLPVDEAVDSARPKDARRAAKGHTNKKDQVLIPPTPHEDVGGEVVNIRSKRPSRRDGTNPRAVADREQKARAQLAADRHAAFMEATSQGEFQGDCDHGAFLNCVDPTCADLREGIIGRYLHPATVGGE